MADEQTVTGVTESANPDATGTDAAQQTVDAGGTPEQIAEFESRFGKGKTLADVQRIALEQDKMVGKFAERLGKVDALETELSWLKDAMSRRQEEARQAPPAQPNIPEYDPLNPGQYIDARLAENNKRLAEQLQKYQVQNTVQEAKLNFARGRAAAFGSNKKLFGGIEREVEDAVAKAASGLHPSMLADPATWIRVGRYIRAEREEWDKIVPDKTGAAVTTSERPGGRRTVVDDDEITLSPQDEVLAQESGIKPEEAKKILEAEIARKRRRDLGYRG